MDLERTFPDFDEARVVFRGDGLLVVDKPAGVPSQAADPEVPDDLPSRLRGFASYLGTHQRLDAETSGLVLFTTDCAANAPIAAQFEKRKVKKTYLAGVTGWSARDGRKKTLRHVLDGKQAVTHVRLLETHGERSLLELDLETGRTHQARVQLAKVGAPIAGDRLYGGVVAPRLMLHARALEIVSPSGKRLSLEAPVPDAMRAWLEGAAFHDGLERSLRLAFERRWGLLRAMPPARKTTVFRLVDDVGDALPGIAVDFYAGYALATFSDVPDARRAEVLDALASAGFDGVYEKSRSKDAGEGTRSALPARNPRAIAARGPRGGDAVPRPPRRQPRDGILR